MAGGSFKSFRQTQTKTKRNDWISNVGRIAGNGPCLGQNRRKRSSVSEQNKRAVPVPRALPLLLLGDTTDDALDVVPRPGSRFQIQRIS
jgi:hypothetical protein